METEFELHLNSVKTMMEDQQVEMVVILYVRSNQDGVVSIQEISLSVLLIVEMERNSVQKLVMMALIMA